tara:strand:- start:371 stop:523 length:153 start_codon:yes stop_codon:yes gene_type:complete
MVETGWKKEMNTLYEETVKNWWSTGNDNKAKGTSGYIHLGQGPKKERDEE